MSHPGFWHVPTEYETQINGQQRQPQQQQKERTRSVVKNVIDCCEYVTHGRDTRPTRLLLKSATALHTDNSCNLKK